MRPDRSAQKCRTCLASAAYEERQISYPFKFGERVVIFENVPASVCRQCGESLLSAATARLIDQLARGERPPTRTEEVLVYDFEKVG